MLKIKTLLLFIVTTLIVLLFCSISSAETTLIIKGSSPETIVKQDWLKLESDVPTPNIQVYLYIKDCPYYPEGATVGCASGNKIWLTPKYDQKAYVQYYRKVFFHELGHVFDYYYLDDINRRKIKVLLGYPGKHDWREKYQTNAAPAEWFAESAALCWLGDKEYYTSFYGFPHLSVNSIKTICEIMKNSYNKMEIPIEKTIKRRISRNWISNKFRSIELPFKIAIQRKVYELNRCSGILRIKRKSKRLPVAYNFCGKRVQIKNKFRFKLNIEFRITKMRNLP